MIIIFNRQCPYSSGIFLIGIDFTIDSVASILEFESPKSHHGLEGLQIYYPYTRYEILSPSFVAARLNTIKL